MLFLFYVRQSWMAQLNLASFLWGFIFLWFERILYLHYSHAWCYLYLLVFLLLLILLILLTCMILQFMRRRDGTMYVACPLKTPRNVISVFDWIYFIQGLTSFSIFFVHIFLMPFHLIDKVLSTNLSANIFFLGELVKRF